jgi:hypothetical protein
MKNSIQTPPNQEAIYHAKDNTFKEVLGDSRIFSQFLHDFVPIDILKDVKPEDIIDVRERFLPLFQEGRDSDTVKQVNLPGQPPLFVIAIVEHESTVNFRSPFKMLQYITLVLNEFEKQANRDDPGATQRKEFRYPPVLPVIFYDGRDNWTAERNFRYRTALHDVFGKYIPSFEYELVDLRRFKRDDIAKFNDALSFVLLMDRVDGGEADRETILEMFPPGYLEEIGLRIPEGLGKLLGDTVTLLLKRAQVPLETIRELTDYVEKKEYTTMFDVLVNDILAAREKARQEERDAAELRMQQEREVALQKETVTIRRLRELGVSEEIIAASFSGIEASGL